MPSSKRPARRAEEARRPNEYSAQEDADLRRLFPAATRAEIMAALPGRPWAAIQRAATRRELSRPRRPHTVKWEGLPIELLHARYPIEGAKLLAAELGFPRSHVNSKAKSEGLVYQPAPKKRPAKRRPGRTTVDEKAAREARLKRLYPNSHATHKALKARKPKAVAPAKKPAPAPPVKRSPSTPNLNAQATRQQAKKAEAAKPKEFVTAAQVQALGPNHPARWAWTKAAYNGPAAATAAFHQAMQELQQAA